jgi:hypothetical protein
LKMDAPYAADARLNEVAKELVTLIILARLR